MLAFDRADIVNPADVGMRNLPCDANFIIAETRQRGFIHASVGQKLESHRLVENLVMRAIHLAHSALAQQAQHAIASRQDCTRREASLSIPLDEGGASKNTVLVSRSPFPAGRGAAQDGQTRQPSWTSREHFGQTPLLRIAMRMFLG